MGYSIEDIKADILEANEETDERALFAVDLDEALIGYAERAGEHQLTPVYDRFMCIHIYMERDGMTEEEANDHFEYNVLGSIMKGSPIFVTNLRDY